MANFNAHSRSWQPVNSLEDFLAKLLPANLVTLVRRLRARDKPAKS